MSETVVIKQRFCGPPNSANGGYACGIIAQALGGAALATKQGELVAYAKGTWIELRK